MLVPSPPVSKFTFEAALDYARKTGVAIYFIALIGLNILTGYNGQISLGHAGFMAVGAYTASIVGVILFGLGVALMVSKVTRGQRMLRTLMMFPMMFSPILVGFQFKFICERCNNGYMSSYQSNKIGMAVGFLRGARSSWPDWSGHS